MCKYSVGFWIQGNSEEEGRDASRRRRRRATNAASTADRQSATRLASDCVNARLIDPTRSRDSHAVRNDARDDDDDQGYAWTNEADPRRRSTRCGDDDARYADGETRRAIGDVEEDADGDCERGGSDERRRKRSGRGGGAGAETGVRARGDLGPKLRARVRYDAAGR